MTISVTVDAAGGLVGGAARFKAELSQYLRRAECGHVRVIGTGRTLGPGWLAVREFAVARRGRRVALNNVGFFAPGGERWTLFRNVLHFLTREEMDELDPGFQIRVRREISLVYPAARRSDVLVVPCSAMARRVEAALPEVASRVVVRMHPVSANPSQLQPDGSTILCPVLFAPYKQMPERITEWLAAVEGVFDESVRLIVTAHSDEVPASLAASPRLRFIGHLTHEELSRQWARSQAIYFPPDLESFGWPLAEARVNGQPVIARDTAQNREIAGPALCGFTAGDIDSLREATAKALVGGVVPDQQPFDPEAYFSWLLGDG